MLKRTAAKRTTFGADLIEGMKLVLAHQRGKIELEQVWPKPVDVKAIRKRVKMSQAEFSRAYGISKRALQEWEQGGRQPDSAARAYLNVIEKEALVRSRKRPKTSHSRFLLRVGGGVCEDQVEDLTMSELDRKQLERKLRDHPLVAARLKHARDTHAAEAAVRECIYGEPITISSWLRSSTYQQVKLAYSQITR
jgi:putative transcriptional regulator